MLAAYWAGNAFFPGLAPCGTWHQPRTVESTLPDVSRASSRAAWLAYRYEPTVVVAKADRNWPTSISTVLGLEVEGRLTCMHSNRYCPDPEASADAAGGARCPNGPVCLPPLEPGDIGAAGQADDWLVYPTPLSDAPSQLAELASAIGGVCSTSAPVGINPQLPFDPRKFAQTYFFMTSAMPPKLDRGELSARPATSLQYWFFYPYNYLPVSPLPIGRAVAFAPGLFLTIDYHQGDFEHVDVLLDAADRPLGVYMARHSDEAATLPFKAVLREPDAGGGERSHPVVFASLGGHASYDTCRPHARHIKTVLLLYDYPVCPADRTTLRVPLERPLLSTVADAYAFREMPLVPLRPDSWACWNGRFGAVPGLPSLASKILGEKRFERLTRMQAWSALGVIGLAYPLQPGPAAPLTQDGDACRRSVGPLLTKARTEL